MAEASCTTVATVEPAVAGVKRPRSVVWMHFEKNEGNAKCNICKELLKDCGNTTNLFKVSVPSDVGL